MANLNNDFLSNGSDDDSLNAQASDNEADVGLADDGAGSVATMEDESTQQLPEDASPNESQESDDDEPDSQDWETTVDIKPHLGKAGEARFHSSQPFLKWKTAEWSLLGVFKSLNKTLSLFFGYDNCNGMRPDWAITVTFVIHLLGEDGKIIASSARTTKNFMYANERIDCGHWDTFTAAHLSEALKKSPVLKVRVEMTEDFVPARVPLNYDSKAFTGMVGLENLGATCYLNALLQMLYHVNSFRKAVYKLPHAGEVFTASTTLALQSVFKNLQFNKREVTTKDLTVAFGWTTAESFMQQDVQEMMRVLIDKLEEKMAGTVVDGFIKNLMAGSVRSFIKCVNVDYESKREEAFYDIQLDVKGCKDIYESFRRYTTSELLEGENQYAADGHGKQDAKKGVIFTKFPPVLTIHLKRFDFDMQTMGFNKIHDHYEFPQRLELDEFLAEDCPEESKQVKNTYLLHSVLVHAGDVGGGHYYAYIRPSVNYDYDTSHKKHLSKDKQWFKFNDEVVMPVKSREAIEHCYGRKLMENAFKGGMSSAYMLVYLRESEARDIMREVVETDIPQDLNQRIEAEMKERNDRARAEMRNKMFTTIYYATEDDIRNFTAYTRYSDLLQATGNNRRSVAVMNGSTKLNVLWRIAEDLEVCPLNIRLWTVDKPGKGFASRPAFELSSDMLGEKIAKLSDAGEMFYVQVLDFTVRESGQAHLKKLSEHTQAWLESARAQIAKNPMFCSGVAEDDVADGCGIGSSNQILKHAMKDDLPAWEEMKTRIDQCTTYAQQLVEKYTPPLGAEEVLFFVKAFDPINCLRPSPATLSQLQSPDSQDSLKSQEDIFQDAAFMDYDSGSAGVAITNESKMAAGDEHSLGSMVTQKLSLDVKGKLSGGLDEKIAEEYMPMKYLGHRVVNRHTVYNQLLTIVQAMLQEYAGDAILPAWVNTALYRLFYVGSPTRFIEVPPVTAQGEEYTLDKLLVNQGVYVFTVDLPHLLEISAADHHAVSYGTNLLPYPNIKTPADWLTYRANRRECTVKPLTSRDAVIVTNAWEAAHGVPSVTSSNLEGTLSTDDSAPSAAVAGGPCVSFKQYIPLTMMFSEVLGLIAGKIGIAREHIILYVTQRGYSCEMEEEAASDVLPMHLGAKDITLGDHIVFNKFQDKSFSVYSFMYQISPFSLVDDKGFPAYENTKCFEFHITDARLRRWRHFYLRHHEQVAAQKAGGGSATTEGESSVSYDLKRRRLSPLPSEYSPESLHGEPDLTMLSKAQWPDDFSLKFDIQEENKLRISVINKKVLFMALTHSVRKRIGLPSNIDHLVTPTLGMSARDLEAWDQVTTSGMLNEQTLLQFTAQYGAVTSDAVKRNATGDLLPSYPLALTGIRAGVVNEVSYGHSDLSDVITSWMDASISRNSLYMTGVQHVSVLDMVFMQSKHPRIRSMIVSVYSFTLLGNVVQTCELDQFGGPFVTYLREDDDYETFGARVRAITGDSDEDWEKCRLAVVKRRVPYFIKRPTISHVSTRLGNTKLTSTDSLEGMGGTHHNDDNHAPAEKDKDSVSLWDSFASKYEEFAKGNKLAEIVKANRMSHKDSAQWSYPQLGIQRPVSDVYARSKRIVPKAIKIT